ncbi:MAG: glycoside hydrolase family 15 protein [Alphaproteobacteria bacterium]|jgi:GH15 family glucan-1,4-alpha-glucosidase|nr:glycoside hydrolase family 15 protein [Alphaproteobacteria bacterium]MBU2040831.1 glycoside hydrolase family 15 protein [Alphaproteobacteria bacterium]MBU2125418.1 glycoside hydrolase family 15 protein [Alphaproteobacteria bacterium]MBU2209486.1 glycoside hydrolase family 15 protein [Alphaproteobacteria bacterium]MBU2290941.1 glycoside hydrolase family 15 protein [Alphaproteobacteria bacterium]
MTPNLDLAPIGNCSISALIDRSGRYVWACAPRVDGDPVFSALMDGTDPEHGYWDIELEGQTTVEQAYIRNTPVLRTVLTAADGAAVEIIDFAPRHPKHSRTYRPLAFGRILRPLSGAPRIRVRLRPSADWGARRAETTNGSNHIRYLCTDVTFRLTTDCPVSHILNERTFRLERPLAFFFGPDEGYDQDVGPGVAAVLDRTVAYWQDWVRTLYLPLEWQEATIRAAVTLKLCAYEETGAIVAAMTTSVPEFPESGRNWDYRYCWIRDAYYVVRALNRLGAVDLLENYLGYLRNLVDASAGGHVQPVYGVGLEEDIDERITETVEGYRGMKPVRIGNQAREHLQHDVYGQIVLPLVQAFYDQRLLRPGTIDDFHALEKVGDRAFAMHDQVDAGLWEFRTIARVHTYSSVMCWAACDRLAKAADHIGLGDRAVFWKDRAATIHARIEKEAFVEDEGRFAASFGNRELDASLLQLTDLGFLDPMDPRQVRTFEAIERDLKKGPYLFRYVEADDFGEPETAFNFCTFWFIEALFLNGRKEEAREIFEEMLSRRTHAGLLSEDLSLSDKELWGNYPQTYSLVGIINCAVLLSRSWTDAR